MSEPLPKPSLVERIAAIDQTMLQVPILGAEIEKLDKEEHELHLRLEQIKVARYTLDKQLKDIWTELQDVRICMARDSNELSKMVLLNHRNVCQTELAIGYYQGQPILIRRKKQPTIITKNE